MSDVADAIEDLEDEAQSLRDNLPSLDEPPSAEQLKIVSSFIDAIQQRLDRLREAVGRAARR